MGRCVYCGVLLALMTMLQWVNSVPIVKAPWGTLQGVSIQGDGGRKMTAYLGIPYAVPPIGELRYERPQSHPGPGKEVFVADSFSPACPQRPVLIGSSRETSEDCLKLDVYSPPDGSSKPLAVMVFIHGGGLYSGDAETYRPSKLVVDGNVIVVVIQYRLGVLGFLTSGDDELPGNLGLWDQNLALRWVKDNVQAFGGDPDRITIFGESAGSWSVGFHLIMPLSKGLFHRAIMQSGAPQDLDRYVDFFDRKSVFKGLTDLLGCRGDSRERLQCLKKQPVDHLMKISIEYDMASPMFTYYFPVADGELIPRRPRELLQDPSFLEKTAGHVDLILGFNNREGSIILLTQVFAQLPTEALFTGQFFNGTMDMCFIFAGLRNTDVLKKVTEFYYRGADYGSQAFLSLEPVVEMLGDCLMNAAITEWARSLSKAPHKGVRYMYVMEHDFAFNSHGPVPGTHHIDDVLLLFDFVDKRFPEDAMMNVLKKTFFSAEEWRMSDRLVKMWTSFARTGDPSDPLTETLGGQWPQFSPEQEQYLSFTGSPQVMSKMAPYADRLAFWLTLLPQLAAQDTQQAAATPLREDL